MEPPSESLQLSSSDQGFGQRVGPGVASMTPSAPPRALPAGGAPGTWRRDCLHPWDPQVAPFTDPGAESLVCFYSSRSESRSGEAGPHEQSFPTRFHLELLDCKASLWDLEKTHALHSPAGASGRLPFPLLLEASVLSDSLVFVLFSCLVVSP